MDDIFKDIQINLQLVREALATEDFDKISSAQLACCEAMYKVQADVLGDDPLGADDRLFDQLDELMKQFFEVFTAVNDFNKKYIDRIDAEFCTRELFDKFNLNK